MKRRKPPTFCTSIRLDEALIDAIDKIAKRQKISRNELMRRWILEGMKK